MDNEQIDALKNEAGSLRSDDLLQDDDSPVEQQLSLDLGLNEVDLGSEPTSQILSDGEMIRPRGFADPEIRRKAMEKSLAVRRNQELKKVDAPPPDPQAFVPTKPMRQILKIALSLDSSDSMRSWFTAAGLHRNLWYDWREIPGFQEWWKTEFVKGIKQYETQWLLTGLKKMNKDFRYWNEVGKKIFGFIDKIAVKEERSPEELSLMTELLDLFKEQKKIHSAKEIGPASFSDAMEADLTYEITKDLTRKGE